MHPDKIRARALSAEPILYALRYVHAAALDSSPARFAFRDVQENYRRTGILDPIRAPIACYLRITAPIKAAVCISILF